MGISKFDELNKIYSDLLDKAESIQRILLSSGYECRLGFYNNHYIKNGSEFHRELFPIPVMRCDGFDVGVDLEKIWVEFQVRREKALALDYNKLRNEPGVEIYGSEKFLADFEDESADIVQQIIDSGEEVICINFNLPGDKPFSLSYFTEIGLL